MFQKEYFYLGFDYVSPLYMPENGETFIVYIINTLLHSHVKILKNHLIHVKYIFDAYEIGMKCISNSLPIYQNLTYLIEIRQAIQYLSRFYQISIQIGLILDSYAISI